MTETLARAVVPVAEERARLKEGVHIERSSRRVRTYFAGKLIADSENVLLVYEKTAGLLVSDCGCPDGVSGGVTPRRRTPFAGTWW